MVHFLLIVHAGSASFMAGLIWFVQVVHYPLLAHVGSAGYVAYQQGHVHKTGLVVAPMMLLEAALAIAMLWLQPELATFMGVVVLAMVWLVTFGMAVPCHRRLMRGYDAQAHRRLVRSNWVRTIGWTARCILALMLVAR